MSAKRVRKKRKSNVFQGAAVSFQSTSSPWHILKRMFRFHWVLSPVVSSLLLIVYFFVYSTDFVILLYPLDALESLTFSKAGSGVEDVRSDSAEIIKANVGIFIYVFVLLYSLFFIRHIYRVVIDNPHLVLMVGILLFGMSYSVNPQQVFFSVVQIVIGLLIAVIYAIQHVNEKRWDRQFCFTILIPLFLVHLASAVLFFTNELVLSEFLTGQFRFGGVPGNPNVAGASAVVGTWTCLYLLLSKVRKKLTRIFCILALCVFVFTIALSGSGTSTSAVLIVVLLLIWLHFLTFFKQRLKRVIYVVSGIFVLFMLVGVIMVNNTTDQLTETFTSSLGKRSDFTGRTDLWEIASDAIKEKPVVGWSFDQHETVQNNGKYEIPFGLRHYHNGFLDTAVAGGLVLLAVVLWNFSSYIRNYFKVFPKRDYLYGFIGPMVILVILNLSEYSILRPLNVIFQFYLCAYFLLLLSSSIEYTSKNHLPAKSANKGEGSVDNVQGRRSRKKKQYRF